MKETPSDNPDKNNATPDKPLAVSSASDFQKRRDERENGTVLELPSGVVVRCKRPSVNKLIAQGIVPQEVAATIMSGYASKAKMGTKEFKHMMETQKILAIQAVVEPKVVEGDAKYDENEISIDDLSDEDQGFIMLFVQEGVTDLANFRSLIASRPAGPNMQAVPKR